MSTVYDMSVGNYGTRTFSEIFPTQELFLEEWKNTPYPNQPYAKLADNDIILGYWLLIARYADSNVGILSEELFKYRVFSTFFTHGPTWIKRLEIQQKLRDLKEEELMDGSFVIHNRADHPGSPLQEELLKGVNQQNTSKYRKSKLEAYATLTTLLEVDVCREFTDRFASYFLKGVVSPNAPLWYTTYTEGDNI